MGIQNKNKTADEIAQELYDEAFPCDEKKTKLADAEEERYRENWAHYMRTIHKSK